MNFLFVLVFIDVRESCLLGKCVPSSKWCYQSIVLSFFEDTCQLNDHVIYLLEWSVRIHVVHFVNCNK